MTTIADTPASSLSTTGLGFPPTARSSSFPACASLFEGRPTTGQLADWLADWIQAHYPEHGITVWDDGAMARQRTQALRSCGKLSGDLIGFGLCFVPADSQFPLHRFDITVLVRDCCDGRVVRVCSSAPEHVVREIGNWCCMLARAIFLGPDLSPHWVNSPFWDASAKRPRHGYVSPREVWARFAAPVWPVTAEWAASWLSAQLSRKYRGHRIRAWDDAPVPGRRATPIPDPGSAPGQLAGIEARGSPLPGGGHWFEIGVVLNNGDRWPICAAATDIAQSRFAEIVNWCAAATHSLLVARAIPVDAGRVWSASGNRLACVRTWSELARER